jgi:hypothetical protein
VIKYYKELQQGSDEWLQARCGLLTASEMKLIMTATMKVANNDKERAHLYELAAQRVTKHVEPSYFNDDMLRGQVDEIEARLLYAENFAPVDDMGFITNDKWGFTLGYSPDGMVGEDGLIECKSRRQKYQMETIVKCVPDPGHTRGIPTAAPDRAAGVGASVDRSGLSYSGGMPMAVRFAPIRTRRSRTRSSRPREPSKRSSLRIIQTYESILASGVRLVPTERRDDGEGEVFL